MIDLIGTAISDEIVQRLKEAVFFAVIVDETPDISHKEQLSITVRYVHGQNVEERLLSVKSVDETSSEILFKTVCEALKEHDIDVKNLRGQCYDGASNVSGCYTGLQARLKELSPSAMFVHCYAHVLNLVIVDTMTSNRTARDFFGVLQNLYVFITKRIQNVMQYTPRSKLTFTKKTRILKDFKCVLQRAFVRPVGHAEQMPSTPSMLR